MSDEGKQFEIGGVRVPDYMRPTYANFVNVNHTPWDFRLVFSVLKTPLPGAESQAIETEGTIEVEAVADIIIPANLMHGFITAMQENFSRYLDLYGPPGMEPTGLANPGR